MVKELQSAREASHKAILEGRFDRAYLCYQSLLKAARPAGRLMTKGRFNAELFNDLGEILVQAGMYEPALNRFETSLQLDADFEVARKNLAAVRLQTTHAGEIPVGPGGVSVVMLTHNAWKTSSLCLQQLLRKTPEMQELIVIDNASTDQTVAELQRLQRLHPERLKLHFNATNLGFAAGCNQGIALSQGSQLLFLNNDVLITPGWLARLQAGLEHSGADLAGPSASGIRCSQQAPLEDDFTEETDIRDCYARMHAGRYAGQGCYTHRLLGFCLLVRREVLERTGGFDLRFGIGNFEDDDFCYRAQLAGFKLWYEPSSYVHHIGHVSFRASGIDYSALLKHNWRLFREKWDLLETFPDDGFWSMETPIPEILARSWTSDLYEPVSL